MLCLSFFPPLGGFLYAIFWQVPGGSVGGAAEDGCGARRFHWWVGPKKKCLGFTPFVLVILDGKSEDKLYCFIHFYGCIHFVGWFGWQQWWFSCFFWWVWMAKWLWLFWWEVLMISVFLWIGKLMIANGNWSTAKPVRNLFDEKNVYKYIYMWEVIFGGIRMGHGLKLLRARWFSIFQTKRPGFWTFLDSSSTYHFWWWVKGYQSFAMNSPCFFGCTSLFWKQPRVSRCYVTQKQFSALIFLQVLRRFSKSLVVLQPIHYHVAEFFIRFPKSPKSYTKSSPKLECPKEFHGFVWK